MSVVQQALVVQAAAIFTNNDPSRLVTAASTNADNDPTTFATHAISFNKYYGWYNSPIDGLAAWADNFHARNPKVPVALSEYGAGGSIYQHTENPVQPAATITNFHPEEWQNLVHETNWLIIKARPYLWTKFVWNLFDFASDSRAEGDTYGRNDKGLVTYDRKVRKDAFYFYQANWSDEPVLYITSRRFTERTNAVTDVKIYSNADKVELLLNGKSLGQRSDGTNGVFIWKDVQLQPGKNQVTAKANRNGQLLSDSCIWILK